MKLFKLPYTQKYDMYHLVGNDNVLILKISERDQIDRLIASMDRNSIRNYKELPDRIKREVYFHNGRSDAMQMISERQKTLDNWEKNGYLIKCI